MNGLSSWWGKLIGAFLGFSLAGPVGALFGIFVGNFFDKGLVGLRGIDPKKIRGPVRSVFHSVTFSVMGHIAKSDGRVSEEEIRSARLMMEKLGLNIEEEREAMGAFSQGKSAGFQLNLALSELKHACRERPELLRLFAELQYRAIQAAGFPIEIKKQEALNAVFDSLGFMPIFRIFRTYQNQTHYRQHYQQYSQYKQSHSTEGFNRTQSVDELAQAYKTLGISESSTGADIKKAYRKLMSQHHPDKLIAKKLSEKQIKEGTEKAQKIQAAYERIRTFRGFK